MTKIFVSATLALSLVVSAPASAQAEDGNLLSNLMAQEGASSTPTSAPTPTFERTRTPEQLARARQYSNVGEDQCRSRNQGEALAGAVIGGVAQALIRRIDRGTYVHVPQDYSRRDCGSKATVDYNDMREAEPAERCEHARVTRTVNGQSVTSEEVRCQTVTYQY